MINYDKIIIIGSKTTAYKCAKIIANKAGNIHFFENIVEKESIASIYLRDHLITWHFCNSNEWVDLLMREKEKTLLISVVNQSILPKKIVEKENITFINLHFALLPNYRGRNCCGWALFNEEDFTGSTWHYLTEKVDEGNLLWQRSIRISENDTSLSLFRKQNTLGIELLEENVERILHEDIKGIPQDLNKKKFFHYAKEKPNNGFLDMNWSGKKISCFLRAMDWGPLYEFGVPMIVINNKRLFITGYKIEKIEPNNTNNLLVEKDNQILIEKDNYKFIIDTH